MSKENLKKCLEIYKKNNSSRHINLPEMREFLKSNFGLKITTATRKPQVMELFNEHLTVEEYPIYNTLECFGMIRMDIQEALGLTLYRTQKILKNLDPKTIVKGRTSDYSNIQIGIYQIDDIVKLMDEAQKGE